MTNDKIKFLIAGVGGQGTVLASDILSEAGIREGRDAKKSDILGLAVRGGSVVSHVQWANNVNSPVVDEGEADILIGFEWLELLRRLHYVKPSGIILANDCRIDPMTVTSGQVDYPTRGEIQAHMERAVNKIHVVPGTQTALDLGEVKTFNIVVLGSLCTLVNGDPDIWEGVVTDRVPAKFAELNKTAFHKGRSLIST